MVTTSREHSDLILIEFDTFLSISLFHSIPSPSSCLCPPHFHFHSFSVLFYSVSKLRISVLDLHFIYFIFVSYDPSSLTFLSLGAIRIRLLFARGVGTNTVEGDQTVQSWPTKPHCASRRTPPASINTKQ